MSILSIIGVFYYVAKYRNFTKGGHESWEIVSRILRER
mgnify:CR=1 FL=1